MRINSGNFLYTLSSIRQKLFKFLEEELAVRKVEGIAPSYGDVLFVLGQKGTMTMQELAKYTLKDKSTISSVVNKLEAGGYILKQRDDSDGRYTNLSLTTKARELAPILLEVSKEMNRKLFAGMTEEEMETLFKLMARVYGNV